MTSRVGYRALIVDNEVPAFRLSQFLMRPELNNKTIQTVSVSDILADAYFQAETSDFIYIDPFYFGLPEAMRFIVEVQARAPGKAITLFRSGRQWQEHLRDLDGLAISADRLRIMPYLDKDLMGDASFSQLVRNNIINMTREYQHELQRSGHNTESMGARSGIGMNYDMGGARSGVFDFGIPAYASNPGVSTAQVRDIVESILTNMARQPTSQTHPLLPAPTMDVAQQLLPQVQQNISMMRDNIAKGQEQQAKLQEQGTKHQEQITKLQEQVTGMQREHRDMIRSTSAVDQRMHDVETRQSKAEQRSSTMGAQVRLLTWMVIALGIVVLVQLGIVVFLLLTHH